MKLNDSIMKSYPSGKVWGDWYVAWFDSLVTALKKGHGVHAAEDAVAHAFNKVMNSSAYVAETRTEAGWYALVCWQAKGKLSHMKEHEEVEDKYWTNAKVESPDRYFHAVYAGETLDERVRSLALDAVLENLARETGLETKTIEAYRRFHLNGEDSGSVAKDLYKGKVGSVYLARLRVEKVLAHVGPRLFRKYRDEYFLAA